MKPATAIGIVVATLGILMAGIMGGTSPASFMDIPALLIIIGGTGGVTLASCGMESMKKVPALYKIVFGPPEIDLNARVQQLVGFAEQARREGLLALDGQTAEIEDDFTRKGLQLVVDGSDPELVREVLEAEIDGMMARHHEGAGPFEKAGGFAPTMGIIGTVMGLVHVLQNLSAPATLGPAISSAFIATLMGVGSANVLYLPIANRLKALSRQEVELRTLTLEGILAVQAGDNPRVVAEKLGSFVPPAGAQVRRGGRLGDGDAADRGGLSAMAGRRGKRGHAAEVENEERWLLTYADMLTLMFALFMVLYSISSVNISKYQSLQQSLKAAFSGSILSGGKAIMQSGSESTKAHTPATAEVPSIVPLTPNIPKPSRHVGAADHQGHARRQRVPAASRRASRSSSRS